jgi:hypothetical protein
MGYTYIRCAAAAVAAIIISSTASAQVVVRGILYDDATGAPLKGTVMLVNPATDAAVVHTATDSLGQFSLQANKGTYQIAAVRPGYSAVLSAPLPLQNGEQLTVRVPIAMNGDPANKIGVLQRIRPDEKQVRADEQRSANLAPSYMQRKMSGHGMLFDRARLEKSGATTLGQFLQMVPGLQVRDPASTSSMSMTRNAQPASLGLRSNGMLACRIGWFVDGHRMDLPGRTDPLTDGLGSIQLEYVEAVEVFRGVAELPTEFAAPDLRCGAIAVWTKRG